MENENKDLENNDFQKIVVFGLDNAGKTSILLSLRREFSKIGIIKPTRGVQTQVMELMGVNISIWDFGGQESYRESYTKKSEKYFIKTKIAIFVIDIQDPERFSEALLYFNDILTQFKELKIFPSVFVLFHKVDPNLSKDMKDSIEENLNRFKDDISNKINYEIFYFYETTIYDLSSIIKALSEILLNLYPKIDIIQNIIQEFKLKINAEAVQLLDNNSLLICSVYKNEEIRDALISITPDFLNMSDSFTKIYEREAEYADFISVKKSDKYFIFKKINLKADKPPYFLLLVKDNPVLNEIDIEILINILSQIIYI